jgi:hypothetical protein
MKDVNGVQDYHGDLDPDTGHPIISRWWEM